MKSPAASKSAGLLFPGNDAQGLRSASYDAAVRPHAPETVISREMISPECRCEA